MYYSTDMTASEARFTNKMMITMTADQHKLIKSFRTIDISSAAILRACIDALASDAELLERIRELASTEPARRTVATQSSPIAAEITKVYARLSSEIDEIDEVRSMVTQSAGRDGISVSAWIGRNLLDTEDD
jgi:hypothetical protein